MHPVVAPSKTPAAAITQPPTHLGSMVLPHDTLTVSSFPVVGTLVRTRSYFRSTPPLASPLAQTLLNDGPDRARVRGYVVPAAREAAAEARLEDLGQELPLLAVEERVLEV